ncbi:MAG TPA: LysM peptidoglycan-binding domain-containing protein [Clostridiaceae bacterium]|nr:LysM peptidoglycan-binding domain-containing protein [Clostridiaceae bacterium]
MDQYLQGTITHIIQPNDSLYWIAQRYDTTIEAIIAANPGVDLGTLYIGQRINVWPGYKSHGINYPVDCITQAKFNLSNHLRLLWEQHITWTRLTIISMVFDLPDVDLVTQRLLRNPKDFEAALVPFYGSQTVARFSALLRNHLVIAANLVNAAKAGDNNAAAEAERIWYNNARDIAAFLASINPYWSQQEWEKMLFDHLALVKNEAVFMLTNEFQKGIDLYDEMERQAMMMADVMTEGIVRQFPGRFR